MAKPIPDSKPACEYVIRDEYVGSRIDMVLKTLEPCYSRSAFQRTLGAGLVTVNKQTVSPSYKVRAGDKICYAVPDLRAGPVAEDISFDILHEDDSIIVVNKPAGVTVHPVNAGHCGTLVGGLMKYTDRLSDVGGVLRRGIVHRLDKDTSGVMVTARTNDVHANLVNQFKERQVKKEYTAVVEGNPELDADEVRMNVSRHTRHPQRMAVYPEGKESRTEYEVVERFGRYAVVLARPRTGRTHQIRLMFSEIGHPIVCDSSYGVRKVLLRGDLAGDCEAPDRPVLQRQALHSSSLGFTHPDTGKFVEFSAPLSADIEEVLVLLRRNSGMVKG